MNRFEPIAIVGQSCVLPGALDPRALWSAIVAGRDLTSPASPHRWRIDSALVAEVLGCVPGTPISNRGGFVDGFESVFDPTGFALDPDALLALDPLFQWTLHVAREALRDAGAGGDANREMPRAGIVMGNLSFPTDAMSKLAEAEWLDELGHEFLEGKARALAGVPRPDPRNRYMSGLPALYASRALGLGAGAFSVDAACASSLYAIALACDALHDRRADLMVAGGVSRSDDLFLRIGFHALRALSASGHSRPLSSGADGLLPAEGAAMVVLKRLTDAAAAGDRILAVIRGIGLSNDGRGGGFVAPNGDGQRRAMESAYQLAGDDFSPSDIALLECHATGTPVGDEVEIRSSAAVFRDASSLAIGSLKGNIGHAFAAAGAASLIKVIGALSHQTLPPVANADDPHPALDASPLRLPVQAEPWQSSRARRAAVSAFGFGGNNAHLILEEWVPERSVHGSRRQPAERAARPSIGIIGLGVVAAGGSCTADFVGALFRGQSQLREGADKLPEARAADITLDLDGLHAPPRDLEKTLPQQTAVLAAAIEACAAARSLPRDRTSVIIGVQCDSTVTRQGIRVRLAEWTRAWSAWRGRPISDSWLAETQKQIAGVPDAATVVGMLPNMPANRINNQLGLTAPSFTVSSEERSGITAMSLAIRALQSGSVDAALAGAVDMGCERLDRFANASSGAGDREPPGDAAVVLLLRRVDDARCDGEEILAVLDDRDAGDPARDDSTHDVVPPLAPLFGHAHACSRLLQVAAAAAMCRHHALIGGNGVAAGPWLAGRGGARRVRIGGDGYGPGADVSVSSHESGRPQPVLLHEPPRLHVFAGADRREVLTRLRSGSESADGPARLVIVAAGEAELAERIAIASALLHDAVTVRPLPPGIAYRDEPVVGEMAAVFTGPAGAYRGMGRELLLALPDLLDPIAAQFRGLREAAGWIYEPTLREPGGEEKLWASSLLCQVHAGLMRRVVGARPSAAIGMCSGETNALFAMGAWGDFDGFRHDIEAAGVYTRFLAGDLQTVRAAWGTPGAVEWRNWRVLAPFDALRSAVDQEARAHLTIINAQGDYIIGGEAAACRRVVERVGVDRARPLDYDIAVHCPEFASFAEPWRRLHHRPTNSVDGVRFYSHSSLAAYVPDADRAADALTGQAAGVVDFPAMIMRAWDDGVRVFVEHGPQGGCTRWIGRILDGAGRQHVATALDMTGVSSVRQAFNAMAVLAAAGVPIDYESLTARVGQAVLARRASPRRSITLPSHRQVSPARATSLGLDDGAAQLMRPAPSLPRITPESVEPATNGVRPMTSVPNAAKVTAPLVSAIMEVHAMAAAAHRRFLNTQSEIHRGFLATRHGLMVRSSNGSAGPGNTALSRSQLEVLASGRISTVFGPRFAFQDEYSRQVRMPEPPLLLTDRVLAIDAEPLSMTTGTIRTETDVRWDSWYLHDGRVPPGIMIEAGQSDLLLISWLGVDRENRGERVYRLLGSEITFHAAPARPGETLRFDITCEGHAAHGDDRARLFFFRSDCWVGDELRVTVRKGQAGFFTDEELASSGGVLWDQATAPPPASDAQPELPLSSQMRPRYSLTEVEAFAEGRVRDCFGEAYSYAETHVRTPRIPKGDLMLLGEVTHLDPTGGPWRRGYMRVRRAIRPDDWFFRGHFKDDPCMPGTLMFDGCLQAMSFYMAAAGLTLDRDAWRFEPVPERPIQLKCRGQVTPQSRELVYEIFVEEVQTGPTPTLLAQVLCTVDGLKACHCAGAGVQLVPDYPLTSRPDLLGTQAETGVVARDDGFRFDYASLLASAWGSPQDSFGPVYASVGARRLPRLPGPPYHFISRVARVEGELDVLRAGMRIETVYDVPPDAWYFHANGWPTMPWSVFLEVALQPCGWVAMATGAAKQWTEDVFFRNLDGSATWTRAIGPDAGPLTVRVRLVDVSRSAGVILMSFEVDQLLAGETVCRMKTVFGFFPQELFANQPGIPATDEERRWLAEPSAFDVDLTTHPARYFGRNPRLAADPLRMLDRVTGYWPDGGRARMGRMRAVKRVGAADWFFKAHFFQDPVQPGSLGLEAMVQLLQFYMIESGLADDSAGTRFEPLELGRTLTWKYRGQVVPSNREIVVEIEVVERGRDAREVWAVADAWLWVDGKRIYEASGLGMRAVPTGIEHEAATTAESPFDTTGARVFWRRRIGAAAGLAEDIIDALARRFVHRIHIEAPNEFETLRGQPVLFLANHQVAVESLLCSALVAGLHSRELVALAKAEHRNSWMGHLAALLAPNTDTGEFRNLVFFDRTDGGSLLGIVERLRSRLANGASLLVHVEGTRALTAGQPVQRMSAVWVDLALAAGAAIVPVRFMGGLPVEAGTRLEFPVGYAAQDYYIGRAIMGTEIRGMDLLARQRRILEAINGLGPRLDEPAAPDQEFANRVAELRATASVDYEEAVILSCLRDLASPSAETRAIVANPGPGPALWDSATTPTGPR